MRLSEANVSVTQTKDPVNARKGAKTSDGRENAASGGLLQARQASCHGRPAHALPARRRDHQAWQRRPGKLASGIHQRFGFGRESNPILHLEYVNI
jgi:hypothetical protein